MPSDYQAIRRDNERRYGTDIGRIGPMLLADRYDDRTHFIYELLQNAEDALAKRVGWSGQRSVRFHLAERELRISHYGKPFDEADVRGICGIAESTKDLTAIGRFGIGFKSVYAFTDRPEVHSDSEDFAIESFVWPVAAQSSQRHIDETLIVIPIREASDREETTVGLQRLGPGALLFLREIEEIEWSVKDGPSGLYLRSRPDNLGDHIRRITVVGQAQGQLDTEQTWLMFSRPVLTPAGESAGHVEVAFSIAKDEKLERQRIHPVSRSPLVVFFPTAVETHLGFLVQGPYRTTPSRDNVPPRDPWNQHCVKETAKVLVDALRWLRDHDLLDAGTLRCLPFDRAKFGEGSMFEPIFEATKHALASEELLPRFGGGHAAAAKARLARTQDLRELFDAKQLTMLFDAERELVWLSGDISQDRTPEIRQYLIHELEVLEVTPETTLSKLDAAFLEAQSDEWICRFYEFLNGQAALRWRAAGLPLVRLADGSHVKPHYNGQPNAFLPGRFETGFPTVRQAVCDSEAALAFLGSLGLTEPDPVDDVVRNVLPKYMAEEVDVDDTEYDGDIRRILAAFATDSDSQRKKLLVALREAHFVMAVDTGDGSKQVSKPSYVYLATERLKALFSGVEGVFLVDDDYGCLRGESLREILEACGATRHLRPEPVQVTFTWEEKRELRRKEGLDRATWERPIEDFALRGVDQLVDLLPQLRWEDRQRKAELLWEALADVAARSPGVFEGKYSWGYSHESRTASFDAAFVRTLNETAWVPESDGNLQRPEFVLFGSLGWKPHPFLQSKIRFKLPVIEQLAKEAGIEPGLLDLLKKIGVTSEAELRSRLGIEQQTGTPDTPGNIEDALKKMLADLPPPTPPIPDPSGDELAGSGTRGSSVGGIGSSAGSGTHGGTTTGGGHGSMQPAAPGSGKKRTAGSAGGRPFISYIGTHPDDEEPDPDGLDQQDRMALEERGIQFILTQEPELKRTPSHNPGFDLFELDSNGSPSCWIEVKAMTASLHDRPVGLSRAQFECAREHGLSYWLYIVEHAGDDDARIVRIQDPAGKARAFTFDHGWLSIAEVDTAEEDRED